VRFEQAALAVVSELNALGLDHALIGGFAVSIRTNPRFTQDIDLEAARIGKAERIRFLSDAAQGERSRTIPMLQ
jgi:hypothetical protein